MKLLLLLVLIGLSLHASSAGRHKKSAKKSHPKTLQWVKWTGSVPKDAVSIWNNYVKHTDYICRYRGLPGFYRSNAGPYCHFAWKKKERKARAFQMLVNHQNFAILRWKGGYRNKRPSYSIPASRKSYVAKNKYGLGMWYRGYFYLPWKGKQYWYRGYHTLTYEYPSGLISQRIDVVKYSKNHEKLQTSSAAEILQSSSVSNTKCKKIKKRVKVSKEVLSDNRWDVGKAISGNVPFDIKAKVPEVSSATLNFFSVEPRYLSTASSTTYFKTHSVTAAVEVPPNHSCAVHMTGKRYELTIPFTAKVLDKYTKNRVFRSDVTGTFKGEGFIDFKAVVDACKPIPNAGACHK